MSIQVGSLAQPVHHHAAILRFLALGGVAELSGNAPTEFHDEEALLNGDEDDIEALIPSETGEKGRVDRGLLRVVRRDEGVHRINILLRDESRHHCGEVAASGLRSVNSAVAK